MTDVFVGRQPLLDRALRTAAYELLFRATATSECSVFADDDVATAQVMANWLTDIGLDDLVGDKLACINVSNRFLVDPGLLECLPVGRVMLEILEHVRPTAETIAGVRRLRDLGFRLALDDFVPGGPTAALRDLVDVVKYDRRQLDGRTLRIEIERDHAAGRLVVVERIETAGHHATVAAAGADYFQGYFFAKPTVIAGSRVPQNMIALVRLAAEVNRPEVSTAELVDLLTQDVALSVKVLRIVNSAASGLATRVDSVQQAAVMIGRNQLRGCVALLLLTSVDDKPAELVSLALTRAKFCELVAERRRLASPVTYFTVGMLSMLDALTDTAMSSIIDQIAVSGELRAALVDGDGPLADVLELAVRLERSREGPFDRDVLEAHQQAVTWAGRITGTAAIGARRSDH